MNHLHKHYKLSKTKRLNISPKYESKKKKRREQRNKVKCFNLKRSLGLDHLKYRINYNILYNRECKMSLSK